ncbi:RluA family pseudouridine synthase [Anaerotalea alkaliphila]|uniref:RNA pseudouridylate synthase n=1 Tax=Anaerotalea alkaliphila TaxID=2662126 RepID=A0A7X5HTE4_9FIRM|nr:RluA family pseudouridine synthase [Anaerotalea alkaliphila]NDL66330.1 RluA family pseudouridine synthase [Anaerotalea alkaliphila]
MESFRIGREEANQRVDKIVMKILDKAPKAFIYKMFRKKNILLNGKRISGQEIGAEGDEIEIYFTKETFRTFSSPRLPRGPKSKSAPHLEVLYEDEHLLVCNKPVGILSQPGPETPGEESLVEMIEDHVGARGFFKPGICNRLDRNTSGVVVAGKDVRTLQALNLAVKEHRVEKLYHCLVEGVFQDREKVLVSYWTKDHSNNRAKIHSQPPKEAYELVEIRIQLLKAGPGHSLLEVDLRTGKSHQIRAQLASIGHPVVGDFKYGSRSSNHRLKERYGVGSQLLHARTYAFRGLEGELEPLDGKTFTAPYPEMFERMMGLLL